MKKLQYFLLDDILKIVNDFFTDFPYLKDSHCTIGDYFYQREISNVKKRYDLKQREFLVERMKIQIELNSNWYNRQLNMAAIIIAIVTLGYSIVNNDKLIGLFLLTAVIVILFTIRKIDKVFIKRNNKMLKLISIFEFIDKFES